MKKNEADCDNSANERKPSEVSNKIFKNLDPVIDSSEPGRPLPPLLGIIGQGLEVVDEFCSGFRKLQDLQGVPEAFMISNENEIIQVMASSENSCLTLSAENFISKYWRYLWRCPQAAASAVLAGLDGTRDFLNRESLYCVLHRIQSEAREASGGKEAFEIADLLPQIAKDIKVANQCNAMEASDVPAFVLAALPQASEYIVCAHALECLALRIWSDREISWEALDLPLLSRRSQEGIARSIMRILEHKNASFDSPPEQGAQNHPVLRLIGCWPISNDN